MKTLNLSLLTLACGFAMIATGYPRERLSFEKLTPEEQKSVETCNQLLKKIAETHQHQDRQTLAQLLAESVKPLNESEPNFFKGWVWRAQAALVLGTKADALTALENLVELGVAKNKDPRVLGVVYAIQKRGWVTPGTEEAPEDSKQAADAPPNGKSDKDRAERERSVAAKMTEALSKKSATPAPKSKNKAAPKVDKDGFAIEGN